MGFASIALNIENWRVDYDALILWCTWMNILSEINKSNSEKEVLIGGDQLTAKMIRFH